MAVGGKHILPVKDMSFYHWLIFPLIAICYVFRLPQALVGVFLWKQCLQGEYLVLFFAAAVLWFLVTILFNIWRSFSLSFGFRPLIFSADEVFSWFVYDVATLGTTAFDTPHEVDILFGDAAAKRTPTICPLWKSEKCLTLEPFHTNCN